MISLKINNYYRDEMCTLYEVLKEAQRFLCNAYGCEDGCKSCPSLVVCKDINLALEYLRKEIPKTKK